MRLFVAVWPPAEVVRDLSVVLSSLAGPATSSLVGSGKSALRWVAAGQGHVTLAFLGEVPEQRRAELECRLARVATRYPPFDLYLAGAGRFGDRVLFVKLGGERDTLRRLAESVSASARRAGLDVRERSFRAHLTVARAEPGADLRPFVAALGSYRGSSWTVSEMHLVHSRLGSGPGGRAAYDTVSAWRFTG